MEQENEAARRSLKKPPGFPTTGSHRAVESSRCETPDSATIGFDGQARGDLSIGHSKREAEAGYPLAGVPAIDFHSPEFNRTDDLNDCFGNYRSFESLDGVVTADQLHQMEHRPHGDPTDPPLNEAGLSKGIKVERDEVGGVDTAAPLTVVSKGRTLLIDTDAERAMKCGKILSEGGLTCTLLITKSASADPSRPRISRIALLEVDGVSITGAFGGFSATVTPRNDRKHLPKWFDDTAAYDLVLDLQPTPSFAGDRLPIGYYAPGSSPAALDEAMAELPEMRGRFKKPQFISFLKNLCFHGRSRVRNCRRCLEVCPVGAIQSADQKLVVNHYLCQGCGGCALTCPADAIRVVHPPQEELLNLLHRRLVSSVADADSPPSLVISDSEQGSNDRLPGADKSDYDHRVYFEVEQIAHVRLEVLLTALAYGAGDILVACGPRNSPSVRKAVESQVYMARSILQALGLPKGKIRLAVIPAEGIDCEGGVLESAGLDTQTKNLPTARATFSPGDDRRALVRLATQHLYDQSGAQQARLSLPVGSPFGSVAVDAGACTLCMACAAACPSGALSASGDEPQLVFRESRCHQCGLCGEYCPEGAIRLLPGLLCDPEAVDARMVLHEAEPLRCVECGVPFASHAMINRIREKLTGHWMYANERQLRRLQMCRVCSARDALGSPEMKSWNL